MAGRGLAALVPAVVPVFAGTVERMERLAIGEPDVCTDPLFTALERLLRKNTRKIGALLQRALAGANAARVRRLVSKADARLARIERKLQARRFVDNVPESCRDTVAALIGEARALLQSHLASA